MAIGPKIEKISFHIDRSTFHDPIIPTDSIKSFYMSRPKSIIMSRSQNARALILVPKYFYVWGTDDIKFFSELVKKGFRVIPIFHFFEIVKNFSFLGSSREPFEIRWCTWGQKKFPLIT